MRATMRTTWLLLSLSFLFHSVYSNDTDVTTGTTAVPTTTASVTELTTVKAPAAATVDVQKETATPTPQLTTPAVTTKEAPTMMIVITTQTQAPAVTKPPPTPAISITVAPPAVMVNATPVAAASSPPKTNPPPATPGNSGFTGATITQTLGTPSPSKTSRTEPSLAPGSVGTTKITEKGTTGLTTDTPAMPSTTISPVVVTVAENGTSPNSKQTATNPPPPTGNTGTTSTTSTPSSLTSAGLPTAANTTAGTTSLQTTAAAIITTATTTTTTTTTTAATGPKRFSYPPIKGQEEGDYDKHLEQVCQKLLINLQDGTCNLTWREHNGKVQFDDVEINGKVKTNIAAQYYEELRRHSNVTLIAILASCGALLIMIVIIAVCASHHRKPYNENQQHLTEELHTVENGYHDNPTLEVMEVQPEMQEKKMALNGEFNDSWIVPIDNLLKEDIPDEEDTHL